MHPPSHISIKQECKNELAVLLFKFFIYIYIHIYKPYSKAYWWAPAIPVWNLRKTKAALDLEQ
jgi:hypothetical protein